MLLAVGTPFLGALIAALLGLRVRTWTALVPILALLPALLLAAGDERRETLTWVPTLSLDLAFRLDGFSRLFAVLIGVIGVLTTLYAASYLSARENLGRFHAYLLLFAGSMLGLVLSENLFATFAFWELTSVTSFLLIGFWNDRPASRDGAVKALIVTGAGGLCLLVAAVLIAIAGGSAVLSQIDVDALRSSPLFVPALVLVLLAAFTKSAQVPFHLWLPTAMEAPTPVSAFLHSATMVKAGIFLVAKLGFLFAGALWTGLVVGFGLLTLFWGAYLALRQTDLKALLAYSTVSQLGLIMALFGLNTPEARFVAVAHLLNHAVFKAALFYVVGIVDHETGTRRLQDLSGLARALPVTASVAFVAALSMAGVPPLGGFVSKELFFERALQTSGWLAGVAVLGSVFTFAYSLKFLSVFVGPTKAPRKLHEAPLGLLAPTLPLAALAVSFGVLPSTAEALSRVAASTLNFTDVEEHLALWHGFNPALGLSALTWGLGALLYRLRRPVDAAQEKLESVGDANRAYYGFFRLLGRFATSFTTATQGQRLPDQLRAILTAFAVLAGYGLIRAHLTLPPNLGSVPIAFVPIAVLLVAGGVGVLLAKDAINAIVFTGLTGFGVAAAFLLLRAPDLALTQLLVEAVTVILFLLVIRFLPPLARLPRVGLRPLWDVLLAGSVAAIVFAFVLLVQSPLRERISPYYLENAYDEAGGKNVVNVILVDFRAFDTLGEITVLAIVAVAVYALVKMRSRA
ncbi:hydrogen gas-evolving membrane-bound hydrogenase subunit E [Deinococcus yavapaiensis]|uniref:Multicomponent K+:H+ antiporter subunit A/multicomponent Na+:H+ antiporter subunit A n=1 Tax=Deinococcus yavapaiensis KR-236 TaxID=694435 RepID=A0A318SD17_9DEIO|nr:hydrogen gas-evolving membrane-bound hydrogenase subunit E [Deinococcus yavapaiensis]PYE56543.1 multicomponent K+:H+ antiporter subunit A/multicomponent Na+:H+ antiporter subunit A [Deinococcus yavapaiensis KR-236]